MRIDCHLHTCIHSPCSSILPERACELASARGLDAIVITEHHTRWNTSEIRSLCDRFSRLAVYAGIEVTLRERYDVVVISGDTEITFKPFIPFDSVMDRLSASPYDNFVFVAHPFRYSDRLEPDLRRILQRVDGIEMNSVNILRGGGVCSDGIYKPCNASIYKAVLDEYELVPLFNSDGHREDAVGAISSIIDTTPVPEDESSLARLLKSSKPREFQSKDLLERLFR